MSLDRGQKVKPEEFMQTIQPINLRTLLTWMSVGADADNGQWAILVLAVAVTWLH